MKEETLRVLKIAPHKEPEVVELKNDLYALQDAVSEGLDFRGRIELVHIEPNVILLLNEEGKLYGLPANGVLNGDILVGTYYVIGTKGEEMASLTDAQIKRYRQVFKLEYAEGDELVF